MDTPADSSVFQTPSSDCEVSDRKYSARAACAFGKLSRLFSIQRQRLVQVDRLWSARTVDLNSATAWFGTLFRQFNSLFRVYRSQLFLYCKVDAGQNLFEFPTQSGRPA
jgi:hypothetical protein